MLKTVKCCLMEWLEFDATVSIWNAIGCWLTIRSAHRRFDPNELALQTWLTQELRLLLVVIIYCMNTSFVTPLTVLGKMILPFAFIHIKCANINYVMYVFVNSTYLLPFHAQYVDVHLQRRYRGRNTCNMYVFPQMTKQAAILTLIPNLILQGFHMKGEDNNRWSIS